jgi:hypothetical protein
MTGRRLLAAAGAALAGLLLAATPASAAEPTVEWTRPTVDKPVLTEPKPIEGTVAVPENQTVQALAFTLEPTSGTDDPENPCLVDLDPENIDVAEDKRSFSLDVEFRRNCSYEVAVTVEYCTNALTCGVLGNPKTTATLDFDVAIPPAQVSGLKGAYDPGSKEVRLTWNGNTEVDLRGYRVERNPPGRAGFETVAELGKGETAFTDKDIAAEHRYRVVAVREGPTGVPIPGTPSTVVTAGPDAPEPTVPEVTPTTRGTTATTRGSATAGGGRPTVRKRTATTVDTGFSRDLPFDPSQTTTSQLPTTTSSEPEGQAAVLAEFDDDEGGDDQRATLVPIAGGLALLMSAVHVRLFSKRLEDDEIPVFPGS